jgi:acyl-CoA thioester hydrolase
LDRALLKIRVIYADTDAMGIVYHTNYIRWFEMGRTELFRQMGVVYRDVEEKGCTLPLTQVFCHYYEPARYDDLIFLETDIGYVKRASMKFIYRIWNEHHKKILVDGYSVHACTDRIGRIVRIPSFITDKIEKFNPGSKERKITDDKKIRQENPRTA